MTAEQIRELIVKTLCEVAPDLKGEPVDPKKRFNEQFEFDSMDFLNYIVGLHRATGLELPERDYPRLATLDGAIAYLADKLPQ